MDAIFGAHYHRWMAIHLPLRCTAWCHSRATARGTLVLSGYVPFLRAMSGSPRNDTLPAYIIGRLSNLSPVHRDSDLHRGLTRANLRRLLCDVVLTMILLHKRHAVPALPLTGGYSPYKGVSPDIALTSCLPPTWYQVTNCGQTHHAPKWPALDILIGLWTSRDVLVAYHDTILTVLGRYKRGGGCVLYAAANQIPTTVRNMIRDTHPEIILDSAGHGRGLAASFLERQRLWAIHYGRGG